jgi:hypothetical protein
VSWIGWAPPGATVLQIGEEFVHPGGFASWDRAYRPVEVSVSVAVAKVSAAPGGSCHFRASLAHRWRARPGAR